MNLSFPKLFISILFASILLGTPQYTRAASLEVSGWIPYWKFDEGIKSAQKNLSKLSQVYPFAFSVKTDGSLKELADMNSKKAKKFFKSAKNKSVDIIPTVMWSSGKEIHAVLSNGKLRGQHVDAISQMVSNGKYHGVDIDYEMKWAETSPFYSKFLGELKSKLDNRELVCTIEPRTPPDSLYREIPKTLEYANDYKQIGKYCDQVVIMAYDQQRADLKLNDKKKGTPYVPVSDRDWVRKVLELTIKTIPKEKIILGIPTYGHEYEVIATAQKLSGYTKLWSLNPIYAEDTSGEYRVKPTRGKSGEMNFSYFPKESKFNILKTLSLPKGTPEGDEVALKALLYASGSKQPVTFNFVTWSDVGAVGQKVDLARELGLRGVSLFKIDGGEDQNIWNLF